MNNVFQSKKVQNDGVCYTIERVSIKSYLTVEQH